MSIQVKLVSRIEFDLLTSGAINFIDTFLKDEFSIGESIYLRCYYSKYFIKDHEQILKTVKSISTISFNQDFNKRLYRVYF